jgi:hypothetical protein
MKPYQIPQHASDVNYTSGPHVGLSTKVVPGAGVSAQGYVANVPWGAREANYAEYYHRALGRYLSSQPLLELHPVHNIPVDVAGHVYGTIQTMVDLVDGGCAAFYDYTGSQSYLVSIYPTLGHQQISLTLLTSNAGYVRKAALSLSSTIQNSRVHCLTDVSGVYYLVQLAPALLGGLVYSMRGTTTHATSIEPNLPQLIQDPGAPSICYARVGQYVIHSSFTFNEDCGCGTPATACPCLGAYNGTLVVGYYGVSNYVDFRVKVGAGAWAAGARIFHNAGTLIVLAVSYDSVRAVWTCVLSDGSVWETSSLAAGVFWTLKSATLPGTWLALVTIYEQVVIRGQTILIYGQTDAGPVHCVSEDLGQTWAIRILPSGTSSLSPTWHCGGMHCYYSMADDASGGYHYLWRTGPLDEPYRASWTVI